MTHATTPDQRPPATHVLTLRDAAVFGAADNEPARRFARRILGVPEVLGLAIEPARGVARLLYQAADGQRAAVLRRLADVLQGESAGLPEAELPDWPAGETVRWVRCGGRLTRLDLETGASGYLRLRHAWLQGPARPLAQRLTRVLEGVAGVRGVRAVADEGVIELRYNPARVDLDRLQRVIETEFTRYDPVGQLTDPAQVPMALSNTLVGLSTMGELLLPIATPAAAGMLVVGQLGTARDAVVQLGHGKVGAPLFYMALLTCSLATGQVLAFALTDWSLRYWQRRGRRRLSQASRSLIRERLPPSAPVRGVESAAATARVEAAVIRPGQSLRLREGEIVPADGTVTHGLALVDEGLVTGVRAPLRKAPGEGVLAGSRVLAGGLDMVAERVGEQTRAGQLAHDLMATVAAIPTSSRLRERAAGMADSKAAPTLATAGVGWLAGDLMTVGAILHQDWQSGPELAVPLLALHHVRAALSLGVLTLRPAAIPRLGECDFVVLDDDDERLPQRSLVVAAMRGQHPDGGLLLRLAAGAALYLGGDIAAALAETCQRQGLVVRRPELLALEADGVVVRQGGYPLRLTADRRGGGARLTLTLDARVVAELELAESGPPRLAETVSRLKSLGLQVFLMGARPDAEVRERARILGIDLHAGELDVPTRRRFLEGLKRRGIKVLLAGSCAGEAELAAIAHVAIDTRDGPGGSSPADFILMHGDHAALPSLIDSARGYAADLNRSTRQATLPNLLCIAGAFGGVLNGITAGVIANLGVANVDRQLGRHFATGGSIGAERWFPWPPG